VVQRKTDHGCRLRSLQQHHPAKPGPVFVVPIDQEVKFYIEGS
jgi:hypothetical protein